MSLQDGYHIAYQRLVISELPKVTRIDVEKSDEENLVTDAKKFRRHFLLQNFFSCFFR